jgi:predicted transcriptional regulator
VAVKTVTYRKVLVRVEDRLWRAVRHFAAANDIQPSLIVRHALKRFLDEQKIDMDKIEAFSEELNIEQEWETPAAEGKRTHIPSKRGSKARGTRNREKGEKLE